MRHTPGERGRNMLNQTGNNLCNWSCRKVALVYLGSRCLGVFTSSRYGCSCRVTAELKGLSEGRWLVLQGVWVEGRRGCCSSASNPKWSHRSARVYQAKAAWSLNAHAANLFNYSPSSAACLMRGLSTDNAGNWTIDSPIQLLTIDSTQGLTSNSQISLQGSAFKNMVYVLLQFSRGGGGVGGGVTWLQLIFGLSVVCTCRHTRKHWSLFLHHFLFILLILLILWTIVDYIKHLSSS